MTQGKGGKSGDLINSLDTQGRERSDSHKLSSHCGKYALWLVHSNSQINEGLNKEM